jgi:hypothetical protein
MGETCEYKEFEPITIQEIYSISRYVFEVQNEPNPQLEFDFPERARDNQWSVTIKNDDWEYSIRKEIHWLEPQLCITQNGVGEIFTEKEFTKEEQWVLDYIYEVIYQERCHIDNF